MAVMEMIGVGALVGLVAHLILGKDGYAAVGEMLLGVVGAVSVGLVYGIIVGMRTFKPEVLVASAVGAAVVLSVAVFVSIRPRDSRSADESLPPPSAGRPAGAG